jgi:CRP/FNR family transcriptional regulator, cyclic AMP receptor protein
MPERRAAVRVLDAVPELAEEITDDRLEGARRHALAATIELSPGRWQATSSDLGEQGGYGLLVVEGLMTRDILLGQTTASELVGSGDLLRPNDNEGAVSPVQFDIAWNVLEPTRLAVLDADFARLLARWPAVMLALLDRQIRRTARMAVHQAILELSPVETRLLVLFWHLAERWGRVSPAGITLRLRLPHHLLGQLVGCRRASVTTAMRHIDQTGLVLKRADGTWLLRGSPPDELAEVHWPRAAENPRSQRIGVPGRRVGSL